jgi:hypothetical protein
VVVALVQRDAVLTLHGSTLAHGHRAHTIFGQRDTMLVFSTGTKYNNIVQCAKAYCKYAYVIWSIIRKKVAVWSIAHKTSCFFFFLCVPHGDGE